MTSKFQIVRRQFLTAALALLAIPSVALSDVVKGGSLKMSVSPEPPNLILGLNPQTPVQLVGSKIYEGLLSYDFDLKPQPELAKSWEISEDGTRYVFTLQDGVTWSDGIAFTADDVVFSFTKFLPENLASVRSYMKNVSKVTALSSNQVEFQLTKAVPAFISSFSSVQSPIMPEHVYEGEENYKKSAKNDMPIGTGPFKLKEWRRGEFIHLVRNENYWKAGLPHLDEIVFVVIPDANARAVALETGQVHVASFNDISTFDVPRLVKLPHLEATTKGYEFLSPMMWIDINHRVEPMNDKRFRRAMLHAIDRQFLAEHIWNGFGEVAVGPWSRSTKFFDQTTQPIEFSSEKAVALLDEMGLTPDDNGVRANIEMLPLPYGEIWSQSAEYVRQSLEKVGIKTTLVGTDAASWRQRFADWDYQSTFTFGYQYGDPAVRVGRTYTTSNIKQGVPFNNASGYSNAKVDALFDKGAGEQDPAKRQEIYSEIQSILQEDVPVLWLLEMRFRTVHNAQVKNLVTSATGVVSNFEAVYIDQ